MLDRPVGCLHRLPSGRSPIVSYVQQGNSQCVRPSVSGCLQLCGKWRSPRCPSTISQTVKLTLWKARCMGGAFKLDMRHDRGRRRGIPPHRYAAAVQASTTVELFATILGYCVLLGSCTRSVPQIVRIVRNQSADGVSMAAQYAELIAYSITLAYNLRHGYAFSTYGDTATCWLQDIILIVLIAKYRKQLGPGTVASGILLSLGMWAMLSGAVSMQLLAALQASTIAIIALGGRLPQIMLNARRGNSGELSPLTSALNLAGNVARLFTTAVLTKDGINMAATMVQTGLNSILVWQSVRTAMQSAQDSPPTAAGATTPSTA